MKKFKVEKFCLVFIWEFEVVLSTISSGSSVGSKKQKN